MCWSKKKEKEEEKDKQNYIDLVKSKIDFITKNYDKVSDNNLYKIKFESGRRFSYQMEKNYKLSFSAEKNNYEEFYILEKKDDDGNNNWCCFNDDYQIYFWYNDWEKYYKNKTISIIKKELL